MLLGAAKLSDRELREFYEFSQGLSFSQFHRITRVYERELLSESKYLEGNLFEFGIDENPVITQLYEKIDEFRTRELKASVSAVAQLIESVLIDKYPNRNFAKFQPKQGLKSWITALVEDITPSEVIQAVAILRERGGQEFSRSWPISRS